MNLNQWLPWCLVKVPAVCLSLSPTYDEFPQKLGNYHWVSGASSLHLLHVSQRSHLSQERPTIHDPGSTQKMLSMVPGTLSKCSETYDKSIF